MNDVRKISAIAQILSICAVALSPNFPAGAAMLACAADDLKVKIRVKCDTCMIGTVSGLNMMKLTPQFHLLVEKIDAVQPGDDLAVDILKLIAESYGMTHVAYLGLQLPVAEQRLPLGYVTYPKSWIERYVSKEYVKADPVVAASLKSILPTDWSSIKLKSKSQIQIFGEAKEFGIGTQGITFPIRGRGGGNYPPPIFGHGFCGFRPGCRGLSERGLRP